MKLRHRYAILMALLAAPAAAAAQQTDTLSITVVDPADLVVTVSPRPSHVFVGDTITFSAVAVDGFSGDTVEAVVRWATTTPERVTIDPVTGQATFTARGAVAIYLTIERLVRVAFLPDLKANGLNFDAFGQERLACAYFIGAGGTVGYKTAGVVETSSTGAVQLASTDSTRASACPDNVFGNTLPLPVKGADFRVIGP